MQEAAARALVQACLEGELRFFGSASPGARIVELSGVRASVVPATPERSIFNAVVYDAGSDLVRAWPELDRTYVEAGVRAWTVWLHPGDTETANDLGKCGHKLDGRPVGMALDLAGAVLPEEAGLEWTCGRDFELVGALNDAAYGVREPAFGAALEAPGEDGWRTYVAQMEGRSVACVCAHDEPGGTVGISAVATLPAARGQGLASRLMAVALREARSRGLTKSALVASSDGRGVYARLGYRDVGAREMWELRR